MRCLNDNREACLTEGEQDQTEKPSEEACSGYSTKRPNWPFISPWKHPSSWTCLKAPRTLKASRVLILLPPKFSESIQQISPTMPLFQSFGKIIGLPVCAKNLLLLSSIPESTNCGPEISELFLKKHNNNKKTPPCIMVEWLCLTESTTCSICFKKSWAKAPWWTRSGTLLKFKGWHYFLPA